MKVFDLYDVFDWFLIQNEKNKVLKDFHPSEYKPFRVRQIKTPKRKKKHFFQKTSSFFMILSLGILGGFILGELIFIPHSNALASLLGGVR